MEFTILGKAPIKMVGKILPRRPERLAAGNPQIASLPVSHRVEFLDRGREIVAPAQNNVDIDDWLSRQCGNRGAADVLDSGCQRAEPRSDPGAECVKLLGPHRTVVCDDDWCGHSNCLRKAESCC